MNGSHLALKDELVAGIDDDGLEIRIGRHQTQESLVFGGEVNALDCQTAIDESHHNVAVPDLFCAICQADVTIEDA